nr:YhgE/Pip domain-containing protein [Lactobacillus sp. HBUAS51381]
MLKAAGTSTANTRENTAVQTAAQRLSHDLDNLDSTSNATTDLQSQLTKATNNQQALTRDLTTLATHSATLTTGLNQANQSLDRLTTGLTTLNDQLPSLNRATTQLAQGATQLANGTQQLAHQGTQLTQGTTQLATGNQQLAIHSHQLAAKGPALTHGTEQLSSGIATANQQLPQLKNGVSQLATGATTLTSGLNTLAVAGPQLTNALQTATAGNQQVTTGANQLATGSGQATTGAATLHAGNAKLAQTLGHAGNRATVHPSSLTYKQLTQPTTTAHRDADDAPNNGTGMAPYMMSVSLFVGALAFNLMFDMYTPRKYPRSGWRWWLGKASIMTVFVGGEALFMTGLLASIDGLAPIHPWATFLMLLLTGGAFMSIVYWLNLVLGKPGAFFSMVLLVLQLGGSAGTYPLQLTNGFFRAIHPWLPMSYSVNGLRETLMIGNSAIRDMAVLAFIMALFSGLSILFYARRHSRISEIDIAED